MAKYEVTYSCGHKGVVDLIGKEKDRRSKIEWLEKKGLCNRCYQSSTPVEIVAHSLYVSDGKYTIVISLDGSTYHIKEKLKELGLKYNSCIGWYRSAEVKNEEAILDEVIATQKLIKDLCNTTFYPGDDPDNDISVKGFGEKIDIDRNNLCRLYLNRQEQLYEDFANR